MTITLPGQLIRTRRFTLGVPEKFTVTVDGSAVLFLRSRTGDDPVAGLRAVHGDLSGPVLDDQVTAVQEAARRARP